MMTRREALVRMFGAAVAAIVAPKIDLTDMTPQFWNQPELMKLMPWKIIFPDGTTFAFDAFVVAERELPDGDIQLTVQPRGPMTIGQEEPIETTDPEFVEKSKDTPHWSTGVMIKRGEQKFELTNIESPKLSRQMIDDDVSPVPGLKSIGPLTINIDKWEEPK